MCRLLAYLGQRTAVAPLVFDGEHSLYAQSWQPQELLSGSVNADGYGVVWYRDTTPARIAESRPIWHDPMLPTTLATIESGCVFAALRNATPGIPVDRSGLLPVVHERWSFALNGFVPDFRAAHMRALRAALPDDLYALLEGPSDSETLFLLAVAELRTGASMVEALSRVAATVKGRVGDTEAQLNMVMTDGATVAAVRTSTVRRTNSLYVGRDVPSAPGGLVLASEATDPAGRWARIDDHSWVEFTSAGRLGQGAMIEPSERQSTSTSST